MPTPLLRQQLDAVLDDARDQFSTDDADRSAILSALEGDADGRRLMEVLTRLQATPEVIGRIMLIWVAHQGACVVMSRLF
jgi:hypothetical protein